jgi:hypothetical protein
MGDVTAVIPTDWLTFSDPELVDDIVWHNRSFYWTNYDDPATALIENGLVPATCLTPTDPLNDPTCDVAVVAADDYSDDLAVVNGTTEVLDPSYSLLTDNLLNSVYIGVNGNITGDPLFINGYLNGARNNLNQAEFTTLATAAAFDEGGNFIQVSFGPLSLVQPDTNPNNPEGPLFDYHLTTANNPNNRSPAIDAGSPSVVAGTRLDLDIDNDARPQGGGIDIGADEAQ